MPTKSVTENKAGTMLESEEQTKVASSDGSKTPDNVSKVSSDNTPKFTQSELELAIHAARSEGGRDWKVLETERNTLKAQLQTKESELADLADERVKLEKRIDELASNDPEVYNLEKKAKELRNAESKLKDDRRAEEAKWQANAERVKSAEDTLREVAIWEITTEYKGGDAVKLKELCDIFQASSDEQIRKVADTLWGKIATEPLVSSSSKPYSGRTSGGTGFIRNKENPDETLKQGFKELQKK